jgi:two-component system C4-dicarboxylate transport response regulator DctD
MELLQLPRRTLNEKMQRHGLQRSAYRPAGSPDEE